MNKCCSQPDSKACDKDDGLSKIFLKAQERNKEEKNAGQYSPKSSFGEVLHDFFHQGIHDVGLPNRMQIQIPYML